MGHNRVANKPRVRGNTDTYGINIPDPQHCILVTILMSKPNVSNSLHCKGGANKDIGTRVEYVTLTLESSWYSVQPRYRSEDLKNATITQVRACW
jgi:hypothetical protein